MLLLSLITTEKVQVSLEKLPPHVVMTSLADIPDQGGMTMHPQTKCPWSFQPWTMSLSDQHVPRSKLIKGFYVPSIFCPWKLPPS